VVSTLDLLAPYNVLSGGGMLVGSIFGVARDDALSGAAVKARVTGVYSLAKVSAQAWTVGVRAYWDDAAKLVTTVSGGNTLIGVAVAVAANPSATGSVRLNGSF